MGNVKPLVAHQGPVFPKINLGVTLALAGLILALTLTPQLPIQGPSGPFDKLYHLIVFAALVGPTAVLDPSRKWRVAVLGFVLGITIELIQPMVGRNAELLDMVANALGLLLGLGIGSLLRARFIAVWNGNPPGG